MRISRWAIFLVFKVATIVLAGILFVAVMKYGHFDEGKEALGKIFVALACLAMVAVPYILEWRLKIWDKTREEKEKKEAS